MSTTPVPPALTYPLTWEYRVIGADSGALRVAIGEVMGERAHVVVEGNKSREGRWISIVVELEVQTEVERDELHAALRAHPSVRMVM